MKNKLAESQAVSVMPSNETVASVRGCLASTAQQPDNHVSRCSIPICDFKRQQIDWIVIDFSPWLDSGFVPNGRCNMLQPKQLWPLWANSKYQVKHFDRRLFHQEGGTHSFRGQCSMRGAVCQCICSLEDS